MLIIVQFTARCLVVFLFRSARCSVVCCFISSYGWFVVYLTTLFKYLRDYIASNEGMIRE